MRKLKIGDEVRCTGTRAHDERGVVIDVDHNAPGGGSLYTVRLKSGEVFGYWMLELVSPLEVLAEQSE